MKNLAVLCLSLLSLSSPMAATQASLPVKLDDGIPVVQLELNGAAVPFMLDTGAGKALHLRPEVARSIAGLRYTGKQQKSIDLAGQVRQTPEFIIPALTVNGLSFTHVGGVILAPWGLSLGKGKQAEPVSVLGLDFFEGKRVLYDLTARRLDISDSAGNTLPETRQWTAVPYERIDEGLLLHLEDNKKSYRMVLDTAANISIVKRSVAEQFSRVQACDLDLGPGQACQRITLPFAGNKTVSPLLMPLPEQFEADGILGSDFFAQTAVLFDLRRRLLYLRPHHADSAAASR